MSGVQDEFADVGLESVSIQIEGFLRAILAAMVNSDTDRSSEGDSETSCLDFIKGEA
jgi:hypothetical protein